jgi:hypothetical protein
VSRGYDCILLYTKIGSDRKIRRLEPGQRWAFIAGVLALAAQSPERGRLLIAEGVAVTDADVAEECGVSVAGRRGDAEEAARARGRRA